jgi:hypothetical protein
MAGSCPSHIPHGILANSLNSNIKGASIEENYRCAGILVLGLVAYSGERKEINRIKSGH